MKKWERGWGEGGGNEEEGERVGGGEGSKEVHYCPNSQRET